MQSSALPPSMAGGRKAAVHTRAAVLILANPPGNVKTVRRGPGVFRPAMPAGVYFLAARFPIASRMPRIRSSGVGGQPRTTASTGTTFATAPHEA